MFFRKKSLNVVLSVKDSKKSLKRTLGTFDLIMMGTTSLIGSGLFSVTGKVAAEYSGSAVFISYIIAGLVTILVSLIYAEISCMIPGAGSLYDYLYVILGELPAFVMLGMFFLEYGLVASFASSAASAYIQSFLVKLGITLYQPLQSSTLDGGTIDLLAVIIVLFFGGVVYLGTILSKRVNTILVIIKLLTITLFVVVACKYFEKEIFISNFNPFGFDKIIGGAS